MAETINFGSLNQGAYRILTFTFLQGVTTPGTGTPTNPSGGAVVTLTPPGGVKSDMSASLAHPSPGVYTLGFSATTPGWWTGTAYAPAGSGQESQPFEIEVVADAGYGLP